MNNLKYIQIPIIQNKKLLSNNIYNMSYITNINFTSNENDIIINFSKNSSTPSIHLKFETKNKKDNENFKKLEQQFYEKLNNNNFISLKELIKINYLTIEETIL